MPWPEMLRAALMSGVAPESFWRMSLAEWRMLFGSQGANPLSRAEFDALQSALAGEAHHGE